MQLSHKTKKMLNFLELYFIIQKFIKTGRNPNNTKDNIMSDKSRFDLKIHKGKIHTKPYKLYNFVFILPSTFSNISFAYNL